MAIFDPGPADNWVRWRIPDGVRQVPIRMTLRTFIGLFLFVCLSVVLTHFYLDARIARFLYQQLDARNPLLGPMDRLTHIASYLFLMVCAIALAGWAVYLYLRHTGIDNSHRRFFLLISVALPVAFLLKSFLQDVFGAPSPREWLRHPDEWGFHWFAGAGYMNAFPSGHMTVLTPLIIALWRFYPRCRKISLALWLALASGLVVTNSHFVSDVIAGAYIGLLVDFNVRMGLSLLPGSDASRH
ncbi:MAG: phosphatase PAP2 family protein [Acidobacteriia bacterium]|nr:phosphatase PAP2 family protein [Terriglobia bacterium]